MNFNNYKKKFKKAQNFLTIRNAYISPELLLCTYSMHQSWLGKGGSEENIFGENGMLIQKCVY